MQTNTVAGTGPRGGHILLVEDEPNIAEAIRFVLGRDGFEVSVTADGAGALAILRARAADLVILDLMLPGQSGFDILAQLRADPAIPRCPVMMLTAKGAGRDREAAQQAGVDAFMTKPFSNADMLGHVRALTAPLRPVGA